MRNYLVSTTEIYRTESEAAAQELIEKAKAESGYELVKYNCQVKERKAKGEVIDTWYKVTLCKVFNDEREPETEYEVNYRLAGDF